MKLDKSRINWLSVVIGVSISLFQLQFLPSTLEFVRNSQVTSGEVINPSSGHHPEVTFRSVNGQAVIFSGSSLFIVDAGDRVEVRYVPGDERHARLNQIFSIWGVHIILTAVGLGFVLAGIGGQLFRGMR
ncbi:DUF3592 domain-containing protein [Caballeronia sp. NK8]|uniref:DUF3592 domain-containing protein n=1 Tax=Caballeronia sp. NK8 TaxID=140098 RepID=UPI001BCAD059|nr:DUF3592 domain-containing protein [Caballeronia sp. NK8]